MTTSDKRTDLLNVLVQGQGEPEEAIALLTKYAKLESRFLLKSIKELVQIKVDGMIMVALAVLTANAPLSFIAQVSTIESIVVCLSQYQPPDLLEYVELLRSKELGKGFGSRPQKWMREILENWTEAEVTSYLQDSPEETFTLIRLIHPRWSHQKGEIIKQFLESRQLPLLC